MSRPKIARGVRKPPYSTKGPCTVEQAAVIPFGAIPEFASLSRDKRQKKTRELVRYVGLAVAVAVEYAARNKADLVRHFSGDQYADTLMAAYKFIQNARKDISVMDNLLSSAEARLLATGATLALMTPHNKAKKTRGVAQWTG